MFTSLEVCLRELSTASLRLKEFTQGIQLCSDPQKVFPQQEFITAVEDVCRSNDISEEEANKLRFDVTKILKTARLPSERNLSKEEWRALKGLQDRQDIFILPADKGRAVCILTKDQYREKVENLIGDSQTYDKLERDPTPKFTRETRAVLKSTEKKGNLDRKTYLKLYPSDPFPQLFYGLPKIHKEGIPLRPIVSSIGSVTYDVSKQSRVCYRTL